MNEFHGFWKIGKRGNLIDELKSGSLNCDRFKYTLSAQQQKRHSVLSKSTQNTK